MSSDVHVGGGSAVAGARSNPVAQSGKCSSILEYLDTVSDGPPSRGYNKSVPRVPDMFDTGTSSLLSLSSTSTSPRQQQRRRRRRQHTNGEESKVGGGEGETRAPWDNSIKSNKAVKTASSVRDSHRKRSSRDAADSRQRGRLSTTRGRTEAADDSPTGRRHREVLNRNYSATGNAPLSSADRIVNGGGNRGSSEQTLDYSSSTGGTEAVTTTVGGITQQRQQQQQRRWVWDEWDDNVGGQTIDNYCGGKMSSNGSPVPPRLSPSARSDAGSVNNPPLSKRDKNVSLLDMDDDECAPAARQAFEDIHATAQSMRANLKQKRSEVLDLKTSLQRVRTSNERRRAKVSERWVARTAAAAEDSKAAAERQRDFARQLKRDVDDLEGKLGGLERQVGRFQESRDRDCALARAECARELKKAREAWMTAEKGRLQRLSEKRAGAIKKAAIRALEPQLSELVKANREEARTRADELEEVLLGLQVTLERESADKVQTDARDYQASLEAEVNEQRHQAEHQLRLISRSNEADSQEYREAARRDLEGERVRFEADRKRTREAAQKELEEARAAEADRASLALAEHARELREAEKSYRKEEEDTRRRLAKETDAWQKQVQASAHKEADERDEIAKREAREKCNEELDMVLARLEAEAAQARNAARAQTQREAAEATALQGKDLQAAQESETKAMERYLDCARRQAELESETKGLEQEIKAAEEQIREESERLVAVEHQHEEGRERWRSRLERLQEECSGERKATRGTVSRLSDRAEETEEAARRAGGAIQEETAGLRASLSVEFAQVEAKVAAVLNRKAEQAGALKKRLSILQGQTKAREEELSDHRRRTFS